ncbi:MAG: serine hydroxymethyltransferase, partial [Actinomycetota bacterium]
FPAWQGGPLMHSIAAKAVAFAEALTDEFRSYSHQVVKNAKTMSQVLQEEGLRIVSGGTDNHLMLVDLRPVGITGRDAEARLDDVGITVNKNAIPYDPEKPFIASGIRLGTPAMTTCGMKEEQAAEVARLIAVTIKDDSGATGDEVRTRVRELTESFRPYPDVV